MLGIAQSHAPFTGEFNAAPTFAKQIVAQPFFKLLDLAGQGLGCGVQLLAGPHYPARLGHGPEISQMLEVHEM
ncbi:hypothetical protein D3C71_1787670 [compost metagenome]